MPNTIKAKKTRFTRALHITGGTPLAHTAAAHHGVCGMLHAARNRPAAPHTQRVRTGTAHARKNPDGPAILDGKASGNARPGSRVHIVAAIHDTWLYTAVLSTSGDLQLRTRRRLGLLWPVGEKPGARFFLDSLRILHYR
jgi:hypothetical protein